MGAPPPGIAAEAARQALVRDDGSASDDRSALDEEELRELEREEYYPDEAKAQDAVPSPPKAGLLDHLFRRRGR